MLRLRNGEYHTAGVATRHERFRIAIVEDVPMIANLYSIALKRQGHEVVMTALTGERMLRALDEKEAREVDVAIVDYRLGTGMDGLTCAKLILSKSPGTNIILATADDSFEKEEVTSHSVQVLKKPFSINLLLECISRLRGSANREGPGGQSPSKDQAIRN